MKLKTQNQFIKVKLLALFVFAFLVTGAFAIPGSSLRLLLPPTGHYTVFIDGMSYNNVNDRFKIDGLRPGNHQVQVVKLIFSRRGHVIDNAVLYKGFVFMPKNSKVWARVSSNGRFIIEQTAFINTNRGGGNNRGNNRDGYNNYGGGPDRNYQNDNNRNSDDFYDEDYYGYNDPNRDSDNRDNSNNNYSGNQGDQGSDINRGGRNQTFQLTINAIKNQSFDTERLKIAKNFVAQGKNLSSEVAEITKLFSFESTKLEFSKYAYQYTSDKNNYVLVQEAFQFSSSTSELQDYIAQYRGH